MDRKAWQVIVHGVTKELDMTKQYEIQKKTEKSRKDFWREQNSSEPIPKGDYRYEFKDDLKPPEANR